MPKPRKYPRYVEWLHSQPCVVSGRLPVEAHQVREILAAHYAKDTPHIADNYRHGHNDEDHDFTDALAAYREHASKRNG